MFTGMMWFDNDPKSSLPDKVRHAADYYRKKYGRAPDLCLVNPSMINENTIQADKIQIRPLKSVLPGHLWIGISDKLPTAE